MELRNTNTEYGSLARALHWLVAIGIFWLIYLGLTQAGGTRPGEDGDTRNARVLGAARADADDHSHRLAIHE